MRRLSIFLIALVCTPALAAAITLGQVDDFQDATLEGWGSGGPNPNPPFNAADAGPEGTGDRALIANADGAGAGGKLVIFNSGQWTGDYLAAGVAAIALDLRNLGESDLAIRAVLDGGEGNRFATTQAAILIGGDDSYRRVALSLLPEDLTFVGSGTGDVMAALANVDELRLLHSTFPAFRGDPVTAQLAIDNVTALDDTLICSPGLLDKVDGPADLLWMPGFEVDTSSVSARTTFLSVYNQTDEPRVARFQYFDAASNLQAEEDVALVPHQRHPVNVRNINGLAVDLDDFSRGWVQVLACGEGGGELDESFTGDYVFLDPTGNFATGDQMLRYEDLCSKLQVRLLTFPGGSVTVRLYATDPQGDVDPTVVFTVYDESAEETENGSLLLTEAVSIFDSALLTTDIRHGTLEFDFLAGSGAVSIEYDAFGLYSVSMTGICVEPAVVVE